MNIKYTYPDGVTIGGTFTDGDTITSNADFQAIIDKVVANTRAEQNKRLIKLLSDKLSPITYEQHECVSIEDVLVAIKGENK